MRRCTACDTALTADAWACHSCGRQPTIRHAIPLLAPENDGSSDSFNVEDFERLARLEAGNWWFVSRNELISWALRRQARDPHAIAEIGCGTGYVLARLARDYPRARLVGTDLHSLGLAQARSRVPAEVDLIQADALNLPWRDEFDVVGAFDVIEHIADDVAVLSQIRAALRPGGIVAIAVPQHPWLWGRSDEYSRHKRRYRRGELESKLAAAGFATTLSTSFVTLALPLMLVSRWADRRSNAPYDPEAELRPSSFVNRGLSLLAAVERATLRLGVRWPLGGSRLVLARREG
jgi:SAM-dependent methyltransferase